MTASVRYTVTPADLHGHYYEIACELAAPDAGGQVFRLPGWLRGSYLVRDFAKHVLDLEASCQGRPLAIERLDKRSLRCARSAGPLLLRYRVYAYDESVRKAWLDSRRGFFNGSSLFYCPAGFEQAEFEIELRAPEDAQAARWRVATTLPAQQVDTRGFGLYHTLGYEELIDHPVEMADFQRVDFDVDGVPHALVLSGRAEADLPRLARDLSAICHVERELFGQQPALPQYLFLTHVVANGYGGLEHRDSTALICSRHDLPRPGDARTSRDYRGFLGLCSHEYFHLWNVKRITSERLAASDLGSEAYTQDLWHYEGVTSYYDDLFLLRAGLIEAGAYLDLLAEQATRLERSPGRRHQSLADASFEAWIKYYQPDENSANSGVSYYVKGALAALCLDLLLRRDTRLCLDDVLRAAWQRYGAQGIAMPEGGLEQLAQEVSGMDLRGFFDLALRSTQELPLAQLLGEFGVQAQRRAAYSDHDNGGSVAGEAPRCYAGLKLKAGDTRVALVLEDSPAQRAGLCAGDQLLAIDGLRIGLANWSTRLQALQPGKPYTLTLFRDDELLQLSFTPEAPPADTWSLSLMNVEGEIAARRKAWLGI
ncbi:Predicted metalloprotease, contains C-terminal PDZ domain [Solimonas aquatica]|uniref:Predicted metalloprotease, contains C-terminal PDZ domain n=1 Tax=Solimonas aquatica TaxID=489703 RepID=A0A1H9JPB2_9GAMM|nr:PDZ domain-containing protein [Solimonas aquatica]SEQ88680.1 Predicted metalloprotease, contains C-terminal PDZ domain [Solimonas aquatica]